MALLTDDWGYPVVTGELDPNDPVVNTGSEYMYQMATVAYHTLHGEQTVVLDENFTAPDGTEYVAGTEYVVPVDGRYWADFDRSNPIDAAVRAQAWTGVAHALVGELGVGTVTASTLQMGLGMSGLFAGVGFAFILAGLGLVWAARPEPEKVPVLRPAGCHRLTPMEPIALTQHEHEAPVRTDRRFGMSGDRPSVGAATRMPTGRRVVGRTVDGCGGHVR